jgi:2'-5' RNA ligase
VERGAKAAAFRDLERLAAGIMYQGAIQVESVDLMQSTLGSDGATYQVLARAALARGAQDAEAR